MGDSGAKFCVSGRKSDSFGRFEIPTLDEHCYPALPETALRRRNEDQTLTRLFDSEDRSSTTTKSLKRGRRSEYNRKKRDLPLIVVGQTWVWKTQDVLIVTDLQPGHYVTLDAHDREDTASTLLKDSNVYVGIAMLLAERVESIEARYYEIGGDTILDVYGTAIVNVADEVEAYVQKPGVENMGIEKEKDFLHQISDIREELTMLQRVLTQQEEVWADFASNVWPEIWARSLEGQKPYYIDSQNESSGEEEKVLMRFVLRPNLQIRKSKRRVQQLDEDADRVERSIITQLDLKAKHASLRESHATAVMSAAVFGFTVITIVFTPLSFVMSLFALPIQSFQQRQIQSTWTSDAGMYTGNYIGKWTGKNAKRQTNSMTNFDSNC